MKNFKITNLAINISGIAVLLFCLLSCATSKKITQVAVLPGIDIKFAGEQVADTVYVTISPIPTDTNLYVKEYVEAMENGPTKAYPVKDRAVHIFPDSVPSIYKIACDSYSLPSYYMRSSDHLDMTINSLGPPKYQATGGIYKKIPYSDDFYKLRSKLFVISRYKLTERELDSLSREMKLLLDKMMSTADPETATRIVTQLDEDFAPYAFGKLPAGVENTLFYTYACARRNSATRTERQQKMLEESLAATAPTPEISLNSLDGQTFNISSYRGKWVVIDFWASWCGSCRRGFEKMKKIYADKSDKLEVVAIACGDQEETWRKALEELELPWVNLLAPAPDSHDGTVAGYPVSAYPTRIIIDPEGRLCDYTIGEVDDFYEKLERFIK